MAGQTPGPVRFWFSAALVIVVVIGAIEIVSNSAGCGLPVNVGAVFLPAAEADYLAPDDLVLGTTFGGTARAYPIPALAPIEILNDTIGEVPVAVTWCPLSATAALFDRRVDGRELTFRFWGDLHHFNLMVEDLETGSLWSQLGRGSIEGELEGAELPLLPSVQTTWAAWQQQHPDTLVMEPRWGTAEFAYHSVGDPREGEDYPGFSLAYAVPGPDGVRVYPHVELARGSTGTTDPESGARLEYDAATRTVSVFDAQGKLLPGITMYWKHRADFHPDAPVWRAPATPPTETGR